MSGRGTVVVAHNSDWQDTDLAANADVVAMATGVAGALAAKGYRAEVVPIAGLDVLAQVESIRRLEPALVFNLCESLARDCRHEGVLPALLDLYDIPYTGSAPLALALALRKPRAKDALRARGVATPAARACAPGESLDAAAALGFPLIVKPSREDASIGIEAASVVRDAAALARRVAYVHEHFRQDALAESYVEGRELYVTLIGNGARTRALPIHEIDFAHMPAELPRIVTYHGKWTEGHAEWVGTTPVVAKLTDDDRRACEAAARAAFAAIGVRDYGRVDIRLPAGGAPQVIDVNPNCDISQDAGVARAAGAAGMSYDDLIETIVVEAQARATAEKQGFQS